MVSGAVLAFVLQGPARFVASSNVAPVVQFNCSLDVFNVVVGGANGTLVSTLKGVTVALA